MISCRHFVFAFSLLLFVTRFASSVETGQSDMQCVRVAQDAHSFVLASSGRSFVPWGFNYDHDEQGRLLEDYWEKEWPKVEDDFREMKLLGANVVRVHLQFGKIMTTAEKANEANLDRLVRLVSLAEQLHLYLDITGLGCYRKKDVPQWYDRLGEQQRWEARLASGRPLLGDAQEPRHLLL